MIKIKVIPDILNKENRKQHSVEYSKGLTIADALKSRNIKMLDQRIIINGKCEYELNQKINDNTEIVVTPRIEDTGDIFTGIAVVGLVALGGFGIVGAWALWSAGMIGVNWIASKFTPKPSYGKSSSSGEIDDSSPTYGWDGIENTQSAGLPLAIIYGENRVGGNTVNMSLKQTGSQELVFFSATAETDYTDSGWIESYTSGGVRYYKRDLRSLVRINAFSIGFLSSSISQWVYVYYKKTSESSFSGAISYGLISDRAYTMQSDSIDLDYYDIEIVIVYQAALSLQFINFGILQTIPEEFSQKLNVLLSLGEGEVSDISDVQIDDNPISNYEKASYAIRLGLNEQTQITNFEDINNFFQINSKLLKNIKYSYTTYNNNINGFDVNLMFPNGIWSSNDSGDYNQWSVNVKVEYKLSSSQTWIDNGTVIVNYKTKEAYRKVITIRELSVGRYDIRISKLTDDPDNQYYYGECDIININEFITQSLTYPNTALLGVTIPASEQISSNIPTITSLVKGIKILSPQIKDLEGNLIDYDDYYYDDKNDVYKLISDNSVLTYDDNTLIRQYSANPIWCLYDFLTNTRYGLGNYISSNDINFDSMKECAKYCDTLAAGVIGKRLRLDIVLDSLSSVIDILAQMAQSFRGFIFFSEGKIKVVIDKPEISTQIFSMGNIISGTFSESVKSIKEKFNTIEVTYYDKDNNYKQDIVVVEDEENIELVGVKKQAIRVFVNDEEHALMFGRYTLKQSKLINKVISFQVAVDGVICQPGDVISVLHDNNSFSRSGRVLSYDNTTGKITIDCDMFVELNKIYEIVIRLSDDTIIRKTLLNTSNQTTREIFVDNTFVLDPANYDIFSIYEVFQKEKQYRVSSLKRNEDLNIELSAVEYNADVFAEQIDIVTINEENIYNESGQKIIVDRI